MCVCVCVCVCAVLMKYIIYASLHFWYAPLARSKLNVKPLSHP